MPAAPGNVCMDDTCHLPMGRFVVLYLEREGEAAAGSTHRTESKQSKTK
jgi:hypothetical protein